MADQLALALDSTAPGIYRQRGASSLQRLFRADLPELIGRYDAEFAARLGKYRRERITKAVERFLECGDYSKGIARIKCTNADCKSEYFRLPHRQIVFTFPKVLRVFFRHDHDLFGEVSRLVYRMMQGFYSAAAGRRVQGAAVIAYASAGDFMRFNPHLYGIFLEAGFDRQRRFVHVPSVDLPRLAQYFRASIVAFFLRRSLLTVTGIRFE